MENMNDNEIKSRRINRRIYYETDLSSIHNCGCGATVTWQAKMVHLKSKRHQIFLGKHSETPKYKTIICGMVI